MRIAICGYGEAGKDHASKFLAKKTTLGYCKSTSEGAIEVVWGEWGMNRYASPVEMFNDRHNHRDVWHKIIRKYNEPHGTTLYDKLIREGNDILNGIRDRDELAACVLNDLVDISVWIKRPGFEESRASCTVDESQCCITVLNDAGLLTFERKLYVLAKSWGVLADG